MIKWYEGLSVNGKIACFIFGELTAVGFVIGLGYLIKVMVTIYEGLY